MITSADQLLIFNETIDYYRSVGLYTSAQDMVRWYGNFPGESSPRIVPISASPVRTSGSYSPLDVIAKGLINSITDYFTSGISISAFGLTVENGISATDSKIGVFYDSSNLKINSNGQLNTIQDIGVSSSPTFRTINLPSLSNGQFLILSGGNITTSNLSNFINGSPSRMARFRNSNYLEDSNFIDSGNSFYPVTDGTHDLGTSAINWRNLYVDRVYQKGPVVDVTHPDFGATGLGIVDDTDAILRALTYLISIGGGILFFPTGTYLITTISYNWTQSISIHFVGTGMQSTKFEKYDSSTTPLFDLSASTNVLETYSSISNIHLIGTNFTSADTFPGVKITQMAYFEMDRVYIDRCEIGIDCVGSLICNFYDLKIHHNNIGFRARKSSNNIYSNLNNFYGCKFTGNRNWAVDYDEGTGIYFTGCDIEANGFGQLTFSVNTSSDLITLNGGSWAPPTGTPIRMANSGGLLPSVSISASTITVPQFTIVFLSDGYINAVSGDIGKNINVGSTSGTLVSYDNSTLEWVVNTTNTFSYGQSATIISGVGSGTIDTFTTDNVTFVTPLNLPTGTPGRLNSTGVLPIGLSSGTDYYVINESPTSYRFATSMGNSILPVPDAVTITSPGTGVLTFTVGLGTPGTLTPDFDYWWIKVSETTGYLSNTYTSAMSLIHVNFISAGSGIHTMGFVGTGSFVFRENLDRETAGPSSPGLSIVTIENSHFEANKGRTIYAENCDGLNLTISKTISLGNESTVGGCAGFIDGCRYFEAHVLTIAGPSEKFEITSNCNFSDLHNSQISTLTNNAQNPGNWNRGGLEGYQPGFSENVDLYRNKKFRIHQNVDHDIYHYFYNNGSNQLQFTAANNAGFQFTGGPIRGDVHASDLLANGQIVLKFRGAPEFADNGQIWTSNDGIGFRGINRGGDYAFVFYSSTLGAEIIRNPVDTVDLHFMGGTFFNQFIGFNRRIVQTLANGWLSASDDNSIEGGLNIIQGNLVSNTPTYLISTLNVSAASSFKNTLNLEGNMTHGGNYIFTKTDHFIKGSSNSNAIHIYGGSGSSTTDGADITVEGYNYDGTGVGGHIIMTAALAKDIRLIADQVLVYRALTYIGRASYILATSSFSVLAKSVIIFTGGAGPESPTFTGQLSGQEIWVLNNSSHIISIVNASQSINPGFACKMIWDSPTNHWWNAEV